MSKKEIEELIELEKIEKEFKELFNKEPTDLNKSLYNDAVTDVWVFRKALGLDVHERMAV